MSEPVATTAVVERLWQAVSDGDEHGAARVVHDALAEGTSEEALLLDVIAPVQERVGVEWAADRITVAQEHAATAINERVIASLAHRPDSRRNTGHRGRVVVSCVDGEWHALPARLVAEVLTLHGWRVDYLGAQTPTPHLVAHLHLTNPAAVLLSGSLPTHLPTAHATITACQAIGVPVLAGGRAFGPGGRYAKKLRADRWAADARAAVAVLDQGIPRPDTSAIRHAVDDLPHLADQEYTWVARSRPQLVKQTLVDLEGRFPAMRTYSDAQLERTAEDIAHTVDFLTTALYVDDPGLFAGFLTWTADILTARNVPAHSLLSGLDVLAGQLHDFPRTLKTIELGSTALSEYAVRPVPGARA
ncbi:cobalamin B12-binding domain-containing protein [Streptomyces actinomycinicus]|uniref:Cobalamin B12-binding domain-containing protein n=1 Tax=Streptomyces actinomycinicus TaxID=1695166 RepID=A0A937EIZ6_9ACTN|nr:cobalamin B12-binding domain-containing protein [Streptomyces actinomycinicus]MBL1083706.1 cobalamin B12-binding domain-containing protein [Streptomyces actinomycinicus]